MLIEKKDKHKLFSDICSLCCQLPGVVRKCLTIKSCSFPFDLSQLCNKHCSLRFVLTKSGSEHSSFRFDLSKFFNKRCSLRFDLSKFQNKQVCFASIEK
jgi:hypothetical protein